MIFVDFEAHAKGGKLGAMSNGNSIITIMNEIGFDIAI